MASGRVKINKTGIILGNRYTFDVAPQAGTTGVILIPKANIDDLPIGYTHMDWVIEANTLNTPLLYVAENKTYVYVYCFASGTGGYTATIRHRGYPT